MEENQNQPPIEKIDKLIKDFHNNVKDLEKRIISEMKSIIEKLILEVNLIELNNKEEIASIDMSLIREKRRYIDDLYRTISQEMNQLRKQLIQNTSNFLYDIVIKKMDNIYELAKEETSSIKEESEKSFTEDLSTDLEFEFNISKEIFNENQELIRSLSNDSLSSINNNNSDSNNNNFNSNSETKEGIIKDYFKCSFHQERNAEWQSKNNPKIKMCKICFIIYGHNSEYGELIRINDRIASNSSNLPENFKIKTKQFFSKLAEKCKHLLNLDSIPELTEKETELENMIEFITKVYEEHKKLAILDENAEKANELLLAIFKNITSSEHIILQSSQINIFEEIYNNSKFFITVYPHRHLINQKELKNLIHYLNQIWNKDYKIIEGNAFLIVNDFIGNNYYKNIYECKEKEILKLMNILNEIHNLKNNYLLKECKINENKLELKYDAPYFNSDKLEKIGGEMYYPPLEYFGIGIKCNNIISETMANAYIAFSQKYTNEEVRFILHVLIEKDKIDILVCNKENNNIDKRSGNKIGTGIYLFQDIVKAENYAGAFNINGKIYKILLMAKVQQDKIKEPKNNRKGLWIVDKEFVKIYRIIFKEIFV